MLEIIADTLLVGMAIAFLAHFGFIWRYGWVQIGEPNLWLLALETVFLVGILALGVQRLINDIRKPNN